MWLESYLLWGGGPKVREGSGSSWLKRALSTTRSCFLISAWRTVGLWGAGLVKPTSTGNQKGRFETRTIKLVREQLKMPKQDYKKIKAIITTADGGNGSSSSPHVHRLNLRRQRLSVSLSPSVCLSQWKPIRTYWFIDRLRFTDWRTWSLTFQLLWTKAANGTAHVCMS